MTADPFQVLIDRVRDFIRAHDIPDPAGDRLTRTEEAFNRLALDLFAAQFAAVLPFRRLCDSRGVVPGGLALWKEIPAVPTTSFKELEFTSLSPAGRTTVFHSSGTTRQTPSRHFHNTESLALYEASLNSCFRRHLLADSAEPTPAHGLRLLALTPSAACAPHSSLAHMIETVAATWDGATPFFLGEVDSAGQWRVQLSEAAGALAECQRRGEPACVLGTAFSLVTVLDELARSGRPVRLPAGSRVMETGGYKGRSRELPRADLHALVTRQLGVPPSWIVGEYGMSELSSQAYDHVAGRRLPTERVFRFPPWARACVVSPETGCEVAEGESGLLRVVDLANVRSVMAVQTEDLAVRRGDGFELIGRAPQAEPRGCSLLAA
jgi:hypothetical protein